MSASVFDSSFNRLDPFLQSVLRKLAVFRGGFDLPAAESIAGADVRATDYSSEDERVDEILDRFRPGQMQS